MKNIIYTLLFLLFAPFVGQAQDCDPSFAYPDNSSASEWGIAPEWVSNGQNVPLREWAFFDTMLTYKDILSLENKSTQFGVEHTGDGSVFMRMLDTELVETMEASGEEVRLQDASIYGIYFDGPTNGFAHNYWPSNIRVYNYGAGRHENEGYITKDYVSSKYRSRFKAIARNTTRPDYDNDQRFIRNRDILFNVRVVVATYGDSDITDCTFRVPGIFKKNGTRRVLGCKDFQMAYDGMPDYWGQPDMQAQSTMQWNAGNQQLEIKANQNINNYDVNVPGIAMEVWDKMLVWEPTQGQPSPPAISTDHQYGLWVAGGIVTEDFKMWPRDDNTDTWPAWPDYVFDDDYRLPKLEDMKKHIQKHGYLPGIPSEAEVIAKGYSQHEINRAFLEKIEQLTLYKIEQRERLGEIQAQLESARRKVSELQDAASQRQ
jgi:hypothetical protein